MDKKSPDAFRTISEVAEWLGVPTHVLRFWESRFSQVKPVKRAGGRRYYRPNDMELLGGIRKLLHEDGMTIRGVQKLLREEGVKHVAGMSPPLDSDEMRDITPSNVVPLASKSAQDDAQADAESAAIQDAQTEEDEAAPVVAPEPEVEAEAEAEATPDAAAHEKTTTPDAPPTQPTFGSERVATAAETTSPEGMADTPPPTAPELPGMQGDAESVEAKPDQTPDQTPDATPAPAPLADISHIPADPSDDDGRAAAPLSIALRHARNSGTDAHIAALQALADRLESLGTQMGGQPGQTS